MGDGLDSLTVRYAGGASVMWVCLCQAAQVERLLDALGRAQGIPGTSARARPPNGTSSINPKITVSGRAAVDRPPSGPPDPVYAAGHCEVQTRTSSVLDNCLVLM